MLDPPLPTLPLLLQLLCPPAAATPRLDAVGARDRQWWQVSNLASLFRLHRLHVQSFPGRPLLPPPPLPRLNIPSRRKSDNDIGCVIKCILLYCCKYNTFVRTR